MGQVAHVTEHAAILGHGLFRCFIAVVNGVWTYGGEDAVQNRPWEGFGQVLVGGRSGIGVDVGAEMVVGGRIPRTVVPGGMSAKSAQKTHHARSTTGKDMDWGRTEGDEKGESMPRKDDTEETK